LLNVKLVVHQVTSRLYKVKSDESAGFAVMLLGQEFSFSFPIYVANKEQWATLHELQRQHSDPIVGG